MPAATAACTVATHSSKLVSPHSMPSPPPPRVRAETGGSRPKSCCCMIGAPFAQAHKLLLCRDSTPRRTQMADQLISCDDHMDLGQLPADLWLTRLPPSLRARAPRIEERDGQAVWVCDGKVWGAWGGKKPATGDNRTVKPIYNAFDRGGIHDQ